MSLFLLNIFRVFHCMKLKEMQFLPASVWMLHRRTDGWFPLFLTAPYCRWWLHCSGESEGKHPGVWNKSQQCSHHQPCHSEEIARGTLLKSNGCRRIHKQTLIHTHTLTNTCMHIHTHRLPWQTNQHPTVSDRGGQFCTHTVGYVHAALHLYILYCSNFVEGSLFPKAQTCMNALRVFHRPSSCFIQFLNKHK